ncbi:hypothetical protein [Agrococcus baldri]|uniref:Uncharacterized protein n=1 Tax=Agrococcus baldri TaxID=153730 RepID=A0AA87RBL4_9MICO|nr:hypothetical protein [Agrococcus baldri]GEK80074.1 hypothetical protein ABA31_14250 [Agrococcus baldri]
MSDHSRLRPTTVTWAGALLLLEALGMLAIAVWTAISALGDPPQHIAGGIFLAALAAGAAFFLLQAGRAMLDGRSWSRAGAVVWQVLQLGVAAGTFDGGEGPVWLALILAVLAVAIMVLVLRRSVTLWLRPEVES